MTISRPTSIYITEDTWAQLANTLNGSVNPFYINPEERFKTDNNGTDAKLAPIQEDEISEPMHVEEKSKSLDEESLQIKENNLPPTSNNTLTMSPELSNVSEAVMEESSEAVLQNTDSEIIEEVSVTEKLVVSPKNTVSISEEPSPTNMPVSNTPVVAELPSPASPASPASSTSSARDRALRKAKRLYNFFFSLIIYQINLLFFVMNFFDRL